MSEKIKRNIRCSHCGNETPHEVIATHDIYEGATEYSYDSRGTYYFTRCGTCNDVSLHLCMDYEGRDREPNFYDSSQIYPKLKILPANIVPKKIIKTYDEAVKIKNITPTLFAMQIGKALEFLCKDQNAEGKTLVEQLKDLSAKGIIPPTLLKMTEIMRVFRNIAAHASDIDITSVEAASIDDFFNIIIEYVYIAPYKINRLMERINKETAKKI